MSTTESFRINLEGIIDLLANHLYSSPSVFVRELLQNAVDAIAARRRREPEVEGSVRVSLSVSDQGRPQLAFTDDGIGLTEAETHDFLATIGESSKRGLDAVESMRDEYIGQFGIGLLSCFVVSDEILMVTQSARDREASPVEWRGRADGTYVVRRIDEAVSPGTTVYLSCRPGSEEWFRPQKLEELLTHFGALLPFPISIESDGTLARGVNPEPPPWRQNIEGRALRDACLGFGQRLFQKSFFDAIPIRRPDLGLEGVALVLANSPQPQKTREHRVYVKHMFLADRSDNLLPDWAFFVSCVVDSSRLRPTASRESFYEDDALEQTRRAIGEAIRDYLFALERDDVRRLAQFVDLHERALKALGARDPELLAVFADWLPFETSLGPMTFGDFRKQVDRVRYVPTVDAFRQITQVAAAQGLHVVNGGYAFDSEVLEAIRVTITEAGVQRVQVSDVAGALDDPEVEERALELLAARGRAALEGYGCVVRLKRFEPAHVPALYLVSERTRFARAAAQTQANSDTLYAGLIAAARRDEPTSRPPELCVNVACPLIRRLSEVDDAGVVQSMLRILYLQTLLMGRHPLTANEMSQLTVGLQQLMEMALVTHDRTVH